jgi:hypothetical protein
VSVVKRTVSPSQADSIDDEIEIEIPIQGPRTSVELVLKFRVSRSTDRPTEGMCGKHPSAQQAHNHIRTGITSTNKRPRRWKVSKRTFHQLMVCGVISILGRHRFGVV